MPHSGFIIMAQITISGLELFLTKDNMGREIVNLTEQRGFLFTLISLKGRKDI